MTLPSEISSPIVVITGAAGALGRAVAAHFETLGATVCRIDHAPHAGESAGTAATGLTFVGVDLSKEADARRAFDAIGEHFGRIDVLVNIAGAFEWETLADGSLETWDRLYTINLRTAVSASRAALPWLRKTRTTPGRIVNIGAAASARATAGMGAYAAAKAGVLRFTEALADETKDTGLTVNAVLPTMIDTPRNRANMPEADFAKWVRPEEIAHVVAFLASAEASAVTGAGIVVGARAL